MRLWINHNETACTALALATDQQMNSRTTARFAFDMATSATNYTSVAHVPFPNRTRACLRGYGGIAASAKKMATV